LKPKPCASESPVHLAVAPWHTVTPARGVRVTVASSSRRLYPSAAYDGGRPVGKSRQPRLRVRRSFADHHAEPQSRAGGPGRSYPTRRRAQRYLRHWHCPAYSPPTDSETAPKTPSLTQGETQQQSTPPRAREGTDTQALWRARPLSARFALRALSVNRDSIRVRPSPM
jgi:hypothetical protein